MSALSAALQLSKYKLYSHDITGPASYPKLSFITAFTTLLVPQLLSPALKPSHRESDNRSVSFAQLQPSQINQS